MREASITVLQPMQARIFRFGCVVFFLNKSWNYKSERVKLQTL